MPDDSQNPQTVKPGIKSSEFILSAITTVVGFLIASGVFSTDSSVYKILGLAASVLATLGYTFVRGAVKAAATNAASAPAADAKA